MAFNSPYRAIFPKDSPHLEGGLQTTIAMSSTVTKICQIFTAEQTANAISAFVRTNSVTTAANLKVGFQALTGSSPSAPTGSWLGATGNGYGVFTPTANTTFEVTLGESVSFVRGTSYALVIEWDSTAGSIAIVRSINNTSATMPFHKGSGNFYFRSFSSGAWSGAGAATTGNPHCYGIRTNASHWWIDGVALPATSFVHNLTYGSTSTPDEHGNRIYLPACNVVALWVLADVDGAADLVLYNDAGSIVASTPVEIANRYSATYGAASYAIAPTTIPEGWYRVTLKPSTTTTVSRYVNTYAANAINGRHMRDECYHTSRTDNGSWTDATNAQMVIGVEIEPISSGGGNVIVIED